MTAQGWLQIAFYLAVLTALTPVLGAYMARVYRNERVFLTPVLAPLERATYRALRVNPDRGQDWKAYARTTIVFSALFWLVLYVILQDPGHPSRSTRRASTRAPGTSPSTPSRRSSRTPTGSSTAARPRCPTSRRWPAWRCRTSSPRPWAWPCSRRSSAASRAAGSRSSATSGRTRSARCSTSCCRCRCSAR